MHQRVLALARERSVDDLKREVAGLKRDLTAAQKATPSPVSKDVPVLTDADRELLKQLAQRVEDSANALRTKADEFYNLLKQDLDDAIERWEREEKRRVARVAGGLEVVPVPSPLVQEWADVYLAYQQQNPRVKRPDLIARALPMVLEFWGVAPEGVARTADRPYHGLTLADPITYPTWVVQFEAWMKGRRRRLPRRNSDPKDAPERLGGPVSGSQRNTFRSILSGMYRVAILPQYVKVSGVSAAAQSAGTPANPFAAVPRDRRRRRRLRLSLTTCGDGSSTAPST